MTYREHSRKMYNEHGRKILDLLEGLGFDPADVLEIHGDSMSLTVVTLDRERVMRDPARPTHPRELNLSATSVALLEPSRVEAAP